MARGSCLWCRGHHTTQSRALIAGLAPTLMAGGSCSVRQSSHRRPLPFCSSRNEPTGSASAPNLQGREREEGGVWPVCRASCAGEHVVVPLEAAAQCQHSHANCLCTAPNQAGRTQPQPDSTACLSGVRPRRSLMDRLPISGPPSVSVTPMPDRPLRCMVAKAAGGSEAQGRRAGQGGRSMV